MAKYLEKKAKSLEKLNCNLASETARTTDCQNSGEFTDIVCIQVSNYPFDICILGALFPDRTATNLKGLNLFPATYLSPLSLTSITILNFIHDLF